MPHASKQERDLLISRYAIVFRQSTSVVLGGDRIFSTLVGDHHSSRTLTCLAIGRRYGNRPLSDIGQTLCQTMRQDIGNGIEVGVSLQAYRTSYLVTCTHMLKGVI